MKRSMMANEEEEGDNGLDFAADGSKPVSQRNIIHQESLSYCWATWDTWQFASFLSRGVKGELSSLLFCPVNSKIF